MKKKNKLTIREITDLVLNLKPGQSFVVQSNSQRVQALQVAKVAAQAGNLKRQIISRKIDGQGKGFRIAAL